MFFPDKNNGKAITDDQKEGRTKATPPGEALKPIAKGTALATGGRFEVQADELPSGLSDLEFVTTLPPFDETPSERDALKQTMARMLQGSPQATIAMRRDRVNQFMQDTGAPKDNPDPQLQAGREDLMGMSPKDSEIASRAASRTLKAIEVYRNTIKQQKNQDDFDVQIGSNELVGLVTLLATYLIRGDEEKLSYAKNITIMLARTDFATMFKQLTAQGQKHFKASGGQPFVELVLSAAGLAGTDDVAVFKQGLNYADKGGKTHRKSRRG